jgi:5-methylcytosine-specific restriction endonuclease McrA
MSEYIPAGLKREVAERAEGCCEYSRTQECFSSDPLTVDHITPRALDGKTLSDNLAFACWGCNQHKSILTTAPDPATGERRRYSIRVKGLGRTISPGTMTSQ